jgi:hypothetical protein
MNILSTGKKNYQLHKSQAYPNLIHSSAYSSNLSVTSGLHTDPTELSHGRHERFKKGSLIRCKPVYGCSGPPVTEQNLIWSQNTLQLLQILVVGIVKFERGLVVEHCNCWLARIDRACLAQLPQEPEVHRWIPLCLWLWRLLECVDPTDKFVAMGYTNGVGT